LSLGDFGPRLIGAANDIERAPGQQTRDGVKVRRIDIAADASCFKWNRAATTKWISHARSLAEAPDAKFFYEILQRAGLRAQMRIYFVPDVRECRIRKFFGAQAVSQLLVEAHLSEGFNLDRFVYLRIDIPFPGKAAIRPLDGLRPGLLRQ